MPYSLFIRILLIALVNIQQYHLVKKIDKRANFIAIDYFDQIYLNENTRLIKFSDNGEELSTYSRLNKGNISSFDASDPYMLLLYYKDLNQVVFLDDRLAQIGNSINLDEYQLYQVRTVCKSKNFAVWIYDDFDRRLINYGFNPEGILCEINLKPLNLNTEINYMQESGNHLYVNTGEEILIFDIYGSFVKKISLKVPHTFQIINNKIIYSKDYKIFIYSLPNKQIDTLFIDSEQVPENILLGNNRIVVKTKNEVSIFKTN